MRSLCALFRIATSVLLLLGATALYAWADEPVDPPATFPVGGRRVSAVTESEFHGVFNRFTRLFTASVAREGYSLVLETPWKKPYFGAFSDLKKRDRLFVITVWGGFARAPGMTTDAVAWVACHELAHLLGGSPRQTIQNASWATVEGQSDFYASTRCLKEYFAEERNVPVVAGMTIDPVVQARCESAYRIAEDQAICERVATAGAAFMNSLRALTPGSKPLSFATPDRTRVSATLINQYPSEQCRLDTVLAGAAGAARPRCWFKPGR